MNRTDPDWNLYRSFLAVLREKSLSGAAQALNLTQPTLARHIDALEATLGYALFIRSRQGLAPTEAALALSTFAEEIEANAAALLRSASSLGHAVEGTVRITASEMVGAEVLPSILAGLRRRYKRLEFELVLSNTVDNLLRRDADIAVRMVEPAQEALVVKKLGSIDIGLYAHEAYLAHAGTPANLEDLANHSLIGFDKETASIRAMRARLPQVGAIHFSLRANSDFAQVQALRAGFGIGFCQLGIARRDPHLVRLLPESFDLKLGMWLAMHENLRNTPRCRAAFDGLAEGLTAYIDTAN